MDSRTDLPAFFILLLTNRLYCVKYNLQKDTAAKESRRSGKGTEKTAPPLKWSVTEKKEEPVQETVVDSQGKPSRKLKWKKRKNKTAGV